MYIRKYLWLLLFMLHLGAWGESHDQVSLFTFTAGTPQSLSFSYKCQAPSLITLQMGADKQMVHLKVKKVGMVVVQLSKQGDDLRLKSGNTSVDLRLSAYQEVTLYSKNTLHISDNTVEIGYAVKYNNIKYPIEMSVSALPSS